MIQESTYTKLVKLKHENESFNDLLLRLIYQKQDLEPYFGLFADIPQETLDNAFDEIEQSMGDADRERDDATR